MRILIASRGIDGIAGGVEKMSALLMNELCRRGHAASLLTWDRADAGSFFPLDPRIVWFRIGIGQFLRKAGLAVRLRRALAVRRAVGQFRPDVIVGFQDGMFMAMRLYTLGLGIPVIAAERNAPARFDHIQRGRYRDFVYFTMRFARAITVQCESYRAEYPAFLRDRIKVIPNPVEPASLQATPDRTAAPLTLLSVGRLGYQKNMQALVAAFAVLAPSRPDWRLVIIGEGEDRAGLTAQIAGYNLQDRILLLGAMQDLAPWYAQSQLFCLPSRWEGFPNALSEAMAHGLPAAGYSGCAGVRDLIADGRTGMLAAGNGDPEQLATSLALMMDDAGQRAVLGRAGRDAVSEFVPEKIFDLWENLIFSTCR